MTLAIRSNGQWLDSIARPGEPTYSHGADGGCLAASWKMSLPPNFSHPALKSGSLIEIKDGPKNVWAGVLAEPDIEDDWSMTAEGLFHEGGGGSRAGYICFDSGLNTTSTPDVAIDQAIARGLRWKRPTSISNVAFAATGSTDSLNYVGDLLDAWAQSQGKRWGVNADREVYATADPTVPSYFMTPGSGRFGLADDEYASDIFLRYSTGSGYATATVGDAEARAKWSRREYGVDLTSRGVITGTAASATGAGILAKGKARQGLTNGLELSKWQITTPGGQPASLAHIKGQEKVRMFGVMDKQGRPVPYLDWIIGETSFQAGATTVGLSPVGLVARTLADVIAEAMGDAA